MAGTMYEIDDLTQLSALQHMSFSPGNALIHLEQTWAESGRAANWRSQLQNGWLHKYVTAFMNYRTQPSLAERRVESQVWSYRPFSCPVALPNHNE